MSELIERIKKEVKKNSRGRGQYPAKLKIDIIAYVKTKQKKGTPAVATAKELGVSIQTINGWIYTAKKARKKILKPKAEAKPTPTTTSKARGPYKARKKPGLKPGKKAAIKKPNHKADVIINARIPNGELTYSNGVLVVEGSAAKTILVELIGGLS